MTKRPRKRRAAVAKTAPPDRVNPRACRAFRPAAPIGCANWEPRNGGKVPTVGAGADFFGVVALATVSGQTFEALAQGDSWVHGFFPASLRLAAQREAPREGRRKRHFACSAPTHRSVGELDAAALGKMSLPEGAWPDRRRANAGRAWWAIHSPRESFGPRAVVARQSPRIQRADFPHRV
jgi:hypothetical protein